MPGVGELGGGVTTEKAAPARIVRVAEQLDVLARANAAMARELDALAADRHGRSQATVLRLEHLVQRMRPAAAARSTLAGLDGELLLAGVREWQRRRAGEPG